MTDFKQEKLRLLEFMRIKNIPYDKNRNTWKCQNHDDKTPSAVYYETGKNSDTPVLWCPVCQESWSVIDLAGIMHGVTNFKEKLKIVRDTLNITNTQLTPKKKQEVSNPQPFPTDRTEKDKINNKILEISEKNIEKWGKRTNQSWKYFNEDGKIIAIDIRYEKEGERKTVQTFWYDGQLKWYKTPIFIYNTHKIKEDKPIIIHEGAKCAEIGTENLLEFNHISWSGGSSKADKVDWKILKDKKVYILPDNDEPGEKAAKQIKKQLPNAIIIKNPSEEKGGDIEQILQIMSPEEFSKYINNIEPEKKEIKKVEINDSYIIPPGSGADDSTRIFLIKSILSSFLEFRYNIITCQHEFCNKGQNNWKPITDRIFNTIRATLLETYMKTCPADDLKTVIESYYSYEYDPVKSYFDKLPEWDGTDYILELANQVKIKYGQFGEDINADDIWYNYLSKWLVASVAQMLGQRINHTCLTLLGPQGRGKTTWLQNLGISEDLTYVGEVNPGDKDSKILYAEKSHIVLDELESTTKYDMAKIKSNMTLKNIVVRRPYGRYKEQLPRRANFCANANDIDVLGDLTGARRWLCIEIEDINYEDNTPEFMKKVYCQAYAMLKNGFKYYFDKEEIPQLNKNNERFYETCHEEEALLKIINRPDEKNDMFTTPEILTTTEIISELSDMFKNIRFSKRKLGQVLRKYNFNRKCRSSDRLWGYEIFKR